MHGATRDDHPGLADQALGVVEEGIDHIALALGGLLVHVLVGAENRGEGAEAKSSRLTVVSSTSRVVALM